MQIVKTGKRKDGKLGLAVAKLPCAIEISPDAHGRAEAMLSSYVEQGEGDYAQHEVRLSALEITSLLNKLANPKDQEASDAIGKTLSDSLRDLTRLAALAAGTMPKI